MGKIRRAKRKRQKIILEGLLYTTIHSFFHTMAATAATATATLGGQVWLSHSTFLFKWQSFCFVNILLAISRRSVYRL